MIRKIRAQLDTAQIRWRGWQYSAIGGQEIHVHPGDRSFWVDTYFRSWEEQTLERMQAVLRRGMTFCDIGAWVGPISIHAAKLGAEVVCFEPDPAAYERLLFNLHMNVPGQVKPFNFALGAADGVRRLAPLAQFLGQSGSSLYAPEDRTETAQVLALSWTSAVRLLGLPAFDMVKIDIEGGEAELLPEMLPWLRQHRPHLLLATHWRFIPGERREGFARALSELAAVYPGGKADLSLVEDGFPTFSFSPAGEAT